MVNVLHFKIIRKNNQCILTHITINVNIKNKRLVDF